MSSTGQATSSSSTVQSIFDAALANYNIVTGIDLSNNPFSAAIESSNSPEAILELLQEREKPFKEHRNENRRLISCLRPAVEAIHSFSGILGSGASPVSYTCHPGDPFNVTSLVVSTNKRFVSWHRLSPCCTSLECVLQPVPL
jgi:hypothetical protein